MLLLDELAAREPGAQIPVRLVPQVLEETARAFPGRIAVDFLGRRLDYRTLATLVDRAARGLQDLGLTPGERVGLCLPNSPYFVIFYFAVMKAGGIVVNYNPLYSEPELATQVTDSGTTMMVVPDVAAIHDKVVAVAARTELRRLILCPLADVMPWVKGLLFRLLKRRELVQSGSNALHVPFARLIANAGQPHAVAADPHDVALLQYTGGTTGIPKGAALTHANLTANTAQEILVIGGAEVREEGVRVLGVLPLFHVFALTSVLNFAVATAAAMILLPRYEMKSLLRTIRRTRPTMFPAVPTLYNAISSAVEGGSRRQARAMRSIRTCVSGGAPLPAEVKQRFEALTGCHVVEGYGLSEASPVLTCNPIGTGMPGSGGKAGSAGLPLDGTVIEIRDLEDPTRVLGVGERGEVCARGPQVMQGYWHRPEDTAAIMVDGALRTGDVGYLDADGYLFLVDRIKDLILCSGYNVYPRTIEEALYTHPGVLEATVIGVPDAHRGEAPKAFVVLRPDAAATVAELRAFLSPLLSRIELPREIEIRDALPRTMIGKLSKKELVAEERGRREAGGSTARAA
ncbi:long-chain-fatty-acid--CoA ligase [Lichenicoccus sp.]|uniref:long-chain-fatty-acid--CoA ligase n=1 Tax=Lichenicoccus sp. TaxID=2781899 RepID=UPI003D0FD255